MGWISVVGLATVLAILRSETGYSKVMVLSELESPSAGFNGTRDVPIDWRDWRSLSLSVTQSAGNKPYSLDQCYVRQCTELFDTSLTL